MIEHKDRREHYPKQNTHYSLYGGSVYEEADQQTLDLIRKSIPPGGDILELGGGDLRYGIPMTRLGFTVLSGDDDPEALRIAKKKALLENARSAAEVVLDTTQRLGDIPQNLRERPRVKPVKLNVIETFPYRDGRFHGVVSTALLYLFPEDAIQKVVDESRRVLKPGGEGTLVFDFLTNRRVKRYEGTEEQAATPVTYTRCEGEQVIDRLLHKGFREPTVIYSKVDVDRPKLGHRLQADKLTVVARTK